MPFDLFSRRSKPRRTGLPFEYDEVPQAFRTQVWYILQKTFGLYEEPNDFGGGSESYGLWKYLRDILREERGEFHLSKQPHLRVLEECFQFFINETNAQGALDFIDLAFRMVDSGVRARNEYQMRAAGAEMPADEAISLLNYRFDQHHLGYQFTGSELMRRDSQFVHAAVTEPAAQLLAARGFEGPNEEFLKAHKAYLNGNAKEAIREALNALESTLKVICTKRRWNFDANKDTAARLVEIVFSNHLIPDYMQSHFSGLRATLEAGVPTVRNRAAGHGQGPDPIEVPKHIAAYVLHMTASAITLLVASHESLK